MRFTAFLCIVFFNIFLLVNVVSAENARHDPSVMAWIPAYGVRASMEQLEAHQDIGSGLTRLGLQFWNPRDDGRGLVLAPTGKDGVLVSVDEVVRIRDWARQRHIKVLLTVYNNSQVADHWDWALAKRGFADNQDAFASALVAEMYRYDLDGIDLDLEGEGEHESDRVAYAQFVKNLAGKLSNQGKLLTIDSFHSPCDNAPNMGWWGDWLGHVNTIHSMGYQDLYEGSTTAFTPSGRGVCENGAAIFKYSWQLQYGLKLGYRPDQILMGMPTWLDAWGVGELASGPSDHVREIQKLGAGIALWDLQLLGQQWRTSATWDAIQALRLKPGSGWKALHSRIR
ncbi:hypothetical protein BH11PSE12_BH11PSE12_13590 [soil metagenome]